MTIKEFLHLILVDNASMKQIRREALGIYENLVIEENKPKVPEAVRVGSYLVPGTVFAKMEAAINKLPGDGSTVNRINAIKILREYTSMHGLCSGLKECKDAVDAKWPLAYGG